MSNAIKNVEVIWSYVNEEGVTFYCDFKIEGINGVFRVADGYGINMEVILEHINKNEKFFKEIVEKGVSTIFKESESQTNWGNGWEWTETWYRTQAKDYYLSDCSSWFTTPFGGKVKGIEDMYRLHPDIERNGVKLLFKYNNYRQPKDICYFFSYKK
jgi:hypothetical protein